MTKGFSSVPHTRIPVNKISEFNSTSTKKEKANSVKKTQMQTNSSQTTTPIFKIKNNSKHPPVTTKEVAKQYVTSNFQVSFTQKSLPTHPLYVQYNKKLHLLNLNNNDKLHHKNHLKKLKEQNELFKHKINTQSKALISLQNKTIDLKGAIRVHCRIHTFSKSALFNVKTPSSLLGKYSLEITNSISTNKPKLSNVYYKENNAEIYTEIKDFAMSFFNGYNVSLFMYGQTGSGKTHTLFGNSKEKGIIELIIKDIYKEKKEKEELGEQINITLSATELYNDKFTDLLDNKSKKNLSKSNKVFVRSFYNFKVTSIKPKNKQEVLQMIRNISELKTTASTLLNDKSSRSHTIVKISLSTGKNKISTLTLVDLAGSERINKSKASGIRLEEAKFINLSLSSLGLCINSLINKRSHIPYRNSILTQFLERGIGGNSRTMFIVNLKIEEDSLKESENTMKFAGDLLKVKGKKITN